jgi:DNA-directed RNA polymerase subunit M/transcription elongation factor TFIIS
MQLGRSIDPSYRDTILLSCSHCGKSQHVRNVEAAKFWVYASRQTRIEIYHMEEHDTAPFKPHKVTCPCCSERELKCWILSAVLWKQLDDEDKSYAFHNEGDFMDKYWEDVKAGKVASMMSDEVETDGFSRAVDRM